MGDRASFAIREAGADLHPQEAVFLYGHQTGADMPEILRWALEHSEERWDQASYLAREIVDELTELGGVDGFGISTRLEDNDRDILLVLTVERRVVRVTGERYRDVGLTDVHELPWLSFEDYVAADQRTWENIP